MTSGVPGAAATTVSAVEHGAPDAPAISPGTGRVRVTVTRVDRPRGAAKVGDWFEVDGSRLILPPGQSFCPYALNAVFPIVIMRQGDLPADNWLVRKPYICGPDAAENLVMRVEAVPADAVSLADAVSMAEVAS